MSIIDIGLKIVGDPLIVRKLFAIICRNRMCFIRQRLQEFDDSISYGLSYPVLALTQEGQARLALRQGVNGIMTCLPTVVYSSQAPKR